MNAAWDTSCRPFRRTPSRRRQWLANAQCLLAGFGFLFDCLPTQAALVSLVDQPNEAGTGGVIEIVFDTQNEMDFVNGSIGLSLGSSREGVLRFTDAEIYSPTLLGIPRWSATVAKGIQDNTVEDLYAISVMSPGLRTDFEDNTRSPEGSSFLFATLGYEWLENSSSGTFISVGPSRRTHPLVSRGVDVLADLQFEGICLGGECLANPPAIFDPSPSDICGPSAPEILPEPPSGHSEDYDPIEVIGDPEEQRTAVGDEIILIEDDPEAYPIDVEFPVLIDIRRDSPIVIDWTMPIWSTVDLRLWTTTTASPVARFDADAITSFYLSDAVAINQARASATLAHSMGNLIPEPSTAAMLVIALVGIGTVARRSHRDNE